MRNSPVALWAMISVFLALVMGVSFYSLNHGGGQIAGWLVLGSMVALALTGILAFYHWFLELFLPHFEKGGSDGIFTGRSAAQMTSLLLALVVWGSLLYLITPK